jgi:prevent-host-death family protein
MRGGHMASKKSIGILPDYESVTPFLKGKASKIFKEVSKEDKVLIVQKQNKPQNVIISYERYLELKKNGADI